MYYVTIYGLQFQLMCVSLIVEKPYPAKDHYKKKKKAKVKSLNMRSKSQKLKIISEQNHYTSQDKTKSLYTQNLSIITHSTLKI